MSHTNGVASNGIASKAKHIPPLNEHLKDLSIDHLYHFGISTQSHDLPKLFQDVKFVCCGGSAMRVKKLAIQLSDVFNAKRNGEVEPPNLSQSDRYVLYKVGPVLCVNHGIGVPSMLIMLHEIFKLVTYAGCTDVVFIRVGTSGGIGIEAGSVVVSDGTLNGCLEPCHEACILGKKVKFPATFDTEIIDIFTKLSRENFEFPITFGTTLSCDDFYEAQGRLDGAICGFSEKDKMEFLQKCHSMGVRNIEMEAAAFAAFTKRVGIKSAIVCVTLLNRLNGDQIETPASVLKAWEERPMRLVTRFMVRVLKGHEDMK